MYNLISGEIFKSICYIIIFHTANCIIVHTHSSSYVIVYICFSDFCIVGLAVQRMSILLSSTSLSEGTYHFTLCQNLEISNSVTQLFNCVLVFLTLSLQLLQFTLQTNILLHCIVCLLLKLWARNKVNNFNGCLFPSGLSSSQLLSHFFI